MYPVLILREELVCMVILIFLFLISRAYRMGTDERMFRRLLVWAIAHVALEGACIWTANHAARIAPAVSYALHAGMYLTAVLYASEILGYVLRLFYTRLMTKQRWLPLIPAAVFVLALPFLRVEYREFRGTVIGRGSMVSMGFALMYVCFCLSLILILVNWKKLSRHIRLALLPALLFLIAAETAQLIMPELMFTGGAMTVVTVGFFFSLENPVIVLERKAMMDAMTGVENRNSYEEDIRQYDREYQENPEEKFIFLFADINNLKSVNGLYGHQTGDEYISLVATLLLSNLKSAEHIYRMGGDEFLAVYRGKDEKVVDRELRRVRESCAREGEKKRYVPTLAAGYAVSGPHYRTLHDVLRVADYMMYRNKTEMKLEIALEVSHQGTKLNLTGLTDRVFDAMCLAGDRYYPYMENLETKVARVSPAMMKAFALEAEFFADFGEIWMEKVHPEDRQAYRDDLTATLTGKKQYHYCTYRAKDRAGNYVMLTCRGGVYHGRNGEPDIFSGYIVNHGVPETRDSVTGLENMDVMNTRMREMIHAGEAGQAMMMEINNLIRVRMLYGSATEISLLQQTADLMLRIVGHSGSVFSRGDGIFGIILPTPEREKAEEIWKKIRSGCANGVSAGSVMLSTAISAGAIRLPDKELKGVEEVRSALLYAMEESRYERHDLLVYYRTREERLKDTEIRMLMALHRECSQDRKHFELHYQPIMDGQTGRLTGAEALVRWNSPEFGEISPGRFIAFLENDPAYQALGFDILRQAVRWAAGMRKAYPDFRINVNVTALQMYEEDFAGRVCDILEEEKFPRENLVLELTERCKEMNFEELNGRVQDLRTRGFRVALDDMGTGFSTINLLLHLPVDEVKLDGYFTNELNENPKHQLYAKMLCDAARENRMEVCFEGVETEEMLEKLRTFGQVLIQGYYFDRPLKPEAFAEKYRGQESDPGRNPGS